MMMMEDSKKNSAPNESVHTNLESSPLDATDTNVNPDETKHTTLDQPTENKELPKLPSFMIKEKDHFLGKPWSHHYEKEELSEFHQNYIESLRAMIRDSIEEHKNKDNSSLSQNLSKGQANVNADLPEPDQALDVEAVQLSEYNRRNKKPESIIGEVNYVFAGALPGDQRHDMKIQLWRGLTWVELLRGTNCVSAFLILSAYSLLLAMSIYFLESFTLILLLAMFWIKQLYELGTRIDVVLLESYGDIMADLLETKRKELLEYKNNLPQEKTDMVSRLLRDTIPKLRNKKTKNGNSKEGR